jgi:predicted alpha/beta hydrolase family esterase
VWRVLCEAALDEIVFVGHSLGAMLVLDVVVRAFARDADRRKIADVAIDRLDGISVARRYSRRLA